jgi:hypothetical protein
VSEWTRVLEDCGFDVVATMTAPMHLLEPARVVADEGVRGALRLAVNVLRTPAARRRVLAMRSMFRTHASKMSAVALVARRRDDNAVEPLSSRELTGPSAG